MNAKETLLQQLSDLLNLYQIDFKDDIIIDDPVIDEWNKTGFNPNQYYSTVMEYPEEIKERILNLENNVIESYTNRDKITVDANIQSWDEVGFTDDNIYELKPGNYLHLGKLDLNNLNNVTIIGPASASERNKNIFTSERGEAVLESVFMDGCTNVILNRIKFDGIAGNNKPDKYGDIIMGSNSRLTNCLGCSIINCWTRNCFGGFRIQDCDNCNFHRNLATDKPRVSPDIGMVGIYASNDKRSLNNLISCCESVGMSDGIGIPLNDNSNRGEVSGTYIYNCEIYLPKESYNSDGTACAEDGIDLKNGGSNVSYIIGCRMGGFRPTDQTCGGSGSPGSGIILHRAAQNWIIKDTVIWDSTFGIRLDRGKKELEEYVKNITIDNCLILYIQDYLGALGYDRESDGGTGVFCSAENITIKNSNVYAVRNAIYETRHSKNFKVENSKLHTGTVPVPQDNDTTFIISLGQITGKFDVSFINAL